MVNMDVESKDWRLRACRDHVDSDESLYPGRRVCNNCGGAVCVGGLRYLNPEPVRTRERFLAGELHGSENLFEIRTKVNRKMAGSV